MLRQAPKGTKDIMPENIYKWQYVESVFFDICRKYGYEEIRTPTFEQTDLFARGVGDTSDIVQKQMYTFEDMGGRSMTLRPEGTSGVVRAFLENKVYADAQPTKYCYESRCFRYEKPQAGRLREFNQFGVEVFGSDVMLADAEVISIADTFLRTLKIKDLELRINSIGCPDCRPTYREALKDFFRPNFEKLCPTCQSRFETNPMRILDCKSPVCQELSEGAPYMLDFLCSRCEGSFKQLKIELDILGIEYIVDPGIVRGLDYYTKTAFEFVTNMIGAQGTVCGGGRYNNLIEELGGPSTPGVGFGLGIERLLLLMDESDAEFPKNPRADAFLVWIGVEAKKRVISLATELRNEGYSIVIDTLNRPVKNQMKYADRIGAKHSIVIGDDEMKTGKVVVKNMSTGEKTEVEISEIGEVIKQDRNSFAFSMRDKEVLL